MFYEIEKKVTNITDSQPLRVVGFIKVYSDEAKTDYLTEFSNNELGLNISVSECPVDTIENFDTYVDNLFISAVEEPEIQSKLQEIVVLKSLGLLG